MLGSSTLDLVIGMVFIYLLLSLICSAIREAIEARLKTRALHLERGIRELFNDQELAQTLYDHPLVRSLYAGSYADRLATSPDATAPSTSAAARFMRWWSETIGLNLPVKGLSWIVPLLHSLVKPGPVTHLPSYIPARSFALAMIDMASRPGAGGAAVTTVPALRTALQASTSSLAPTMSAVLTGCKDDMASAIAAVEAWYDGSMDRVSGWYKRETQSILFALAVIVAAGFNVDSIRLVKHLQVSEKAREALVAQASGSTQDASFATLVQAEQRKAVAAADAAASAASAAASAPDSDEAAASASRALADAHRAEERAQALGRRLLGLELPIGWDGSTWHAFLGDDWSARAKTLVGWLLTAFALSFGAPFWFDLLNKLMVIRSTVKPHEKSPEESSEDRQRGSVLQVVGAAPEGGPSKD